MLRLGAPASLHWLTSPIMTLAGLWLVDVRPDGDLAFRALGPLVIAKASAGREVAAWPLFEPGDHAPGRRALLQASMAAALVEAGLFPDEAAALLATWEASYFEHPGLRLFHLVPAEWIATFLPLTIDVPHVATRVLVGRIDLPE